MVSAQNSTRLIYSLAEEDLRDFQKYNLFKTPGGQLSILVGYFVCYLVVVGIEALDSEWSGAQPSLGLGALPAILAAVWYSVLLYTLIRASSRGPTQVPGLIGTHTVELSPQGVSDASETYYENLKWTAITRVGGTSRHLFLYVSPRYALLIPRRAFPSSQAADALLEAVNGWQAAANPKARR